MTDLNALKSRNETRWANAKVTRDLAGVAKRLVAAKARYQVVEAKTGVPWFVIAVIHMRESSQSWTRSLAQGDPIDRVSTHVPAGRGPFPTWEAAAIDALVDCAPHLARQKDWGLGAALVGLEKYNGLGYASRGVPSPYLWAGTNQYGSGKFVADGVYDPNHVDQQPGCAGMILAMQAIDSTIKFGSVQPVHETKPAVTPTKPKPVITPAKTGGGAVVVAGTVAAGVQQGWGSTGWIIAAAVVILIGVGAYLFLKSRRD